jgi:hypothetical protein
VALALKLGFDPNVRSCWDATALHWAALLGNREMVRTLLAHGAPLVDLGGGPSWGTPLHMALYSRWYKVDYLGVVAEFVAAGVELPDPFVPTGDVALDAAVKDLSERVAGRRPESSATTRWLRALEGTVRRPVGSADQAAASRPRDPPSSRPLRLDLPGRPVEGSIAAGGCSAGWSGWRGLGIRARWANPVSAFSSGTPGYQAIFS